MLYFLNENLTDEDILEIMKRRDENRKRLFNTFKECVDGLESDKDKANFISQALPVLVQSLSW